MTTDPRVEAAARALVGITFSNEPDKELEQIKNARWDAFVEDAVAMLAAADAVDPLRRPSHRVKIAKFSWSLQHPAECRPDMLACPVTAALAQAGVSSVADGVWAVELDPDGYLAFSPEAVP